MKFKVAKCHSMRVTQHQHHKQILLDNWPPGVWGSGEKDYLFSGSWGALVIIFMGLGSKPIILGGFREPCKKVKK